MNSFERLHHYASELGFDLCGAVPAEPLREEREDFIRWLEQGRHGEMQWLARDPERRTDPARVLQACRTVIVVGMNYLREPLPLPEECLPAPAGARGRISKYARTRDYHRVLEKRLRKLARCIDEEIAPGASTRGFVDYGPVTERPWAARAGLGFLGKHTLMIDPQQGSFFFLGVLLTTAELALPELPQPMREGCGDCRRCLDACPTGAITEPWRFDARRCLSYLTIEKKGPVDEEFWPQFSGYLFGCDICQDVCPYNQSRAQPVEKSPLGPPIVEDTVDLKLLLEDAEGFLAQFEGKSTPLKRAGAESLRRNAAIVASQTGNEETLRVLRNVADQDRHPEWLRILIKRAAQKLEARIGSDGKCGGTATPH